MKRLYVLLTAVIITTSAFAQAPEKMSYQAVVRDAGNALVTLQPVGMQISILQGSISGAAVYIETHTPTSNINGLVSLEIGTGNVVLGTFNTISWDAGPYFLKTETDPTGGSSYSITGTSQLLSVPYALHANTANSIIGGTVSPGTSPGNTTYWDGTSWVNNSNIFNNGANIGIGTTTPSENLVVSETANATAGTENFLLVETMINPFVSSTQGILMQKDDGQKRGFRLYQDGSDDANSVFKIASFSASADIDRFSIKRDNGNVGIGTNDPTENLVVSETVGATAGTNNFLLVETLVNPFVASRQGILMQKDDGQKRGFKLYQDGSDDSNSVFKIASFSASADVDRISIKRDNGNVGIGTNSPTSKLQVVGLPVFANNSAAIAGGLTVGAFYRTSTGVLMVVF